MSTSCFPSVKQLREALKGSSANPTLRAEYFALVRRYEADCKMRAIQQATAQLQSPVGGQSVSQPPIEWSIGVVQLLIPLRGLFDYPKVMDANDGAVNFESTWPAVDFMSSVEQLEALGGEVLIDVVPTPGCDTKKRLYGIANIAVDLNSAAGRFVLSEARRLQKWQSDRQAWGEEFDMRLSTSKKVRREAFADWFARVPSPEFQAAERNAIVYSLSCNAMPPEPKQSGYVAQAIAEWLQFWCYFQAKKAA